MDYGKVAVYQGGSVPGNIPQNLATVRAIAEDAARLEAHTVVFPELFLAGYDIGAAQLRATAVALTDAPVREACAIAHETGINIIISFAERRGEQVVNKRRGGVAKGAGQGDKGGRAGRQGRQGRVTRAVGQGGERRHPSMGRC